MKVHVTLKPEVRSDSDAKARALRRIEGAGVRDVNLKRFERYGIITGEVDPAKLAEVQEMDVVKAVEPEGRKSASDREV